MAEVQLTPELRFPEFVDEWKFHKLSEVTIKIQDGTHFSPSINDEKDFKYITSKNIRQGYLDLSDVDYISKEEHEKIYQRADIKLGDVLLTKDGASTGNACINTLAEEFSLLSSVAFIRADNVSATNEFIFQLISSPKGQKEIFKSIAGQAITRITLSKLRGYKFTFPSIPEQQKIASFLRAIDERIKLLQKKKTKLEEYKKGVMQKLFPPKGGQVPEIRFKDENNGCFPDWQEKRFEDIYEFKPTNSFSRENLNYTIGAAKNIHYGDIHTKFKSHFKIKDENVPYLNMDIDLSRIDQENYAREGDLVIADASEDYADIGKTIEIIDLNGQRLLAGLHTFLARLTDPGVEIGFMGHLMKTHNIRLSMMKIAQGTKVLGISKSRLAKIQFRIPTKQEQRKITKILSALDYAIDKIENQKVETEQFKKGLLQKMFV